jgi:hypothetical protein
MDQFGVDAFVLFFHGHFLLGLLFNHRKPGPLRRVKNCGFVRKDSELFWSIGVTRFAIFD